MKEILEDLQRKIDDKKTRNALRTKDVRRLASDAYKTLRQNNHEAILDVCEKLLDYNTWEHKLIAFDWAYRERKKYTSQTFDRFEQWLKMYVHDWWDCDDFCTHALGILIHDFPALLPRIKMWVNHEEFAVRRAAAVVLIPSIRRQSCPKEYPFEIANALFNDDHYLVVKGYGWLLKVFAEYEEELVIEYLRKHVKTMPRLAFRYALEKVDETKRKELMAL